MVWARLVIVKRKETTKSEDMKAEAAEAKKILENQPGCIKGSVKIFGNADEKEGGSISYWESLCHAKNVDKTDSDIDKRHKTDLNGKITNPNPKVSYYEVVA